jgi:tetrapyrrole methylase family protein/MazG family protein
VEDPEINKKNSSLNDLIELIESLRGPHGCPWDKKQTPRSMLIYLIEEIYELVDAIESENPDEICEELGDVLFHLFFMARMFQENGHFSIQDVARVNTHKMIRRHPHVFGSQKVDGSDDVVQNWQKIKMSEKNNAKRNSIIDTIPAKLPALMRAYMMTDRTSKAGFDCNTSSELVTKLEKKLAELKLTLSGTEHERLDRQLGDFLFTLVNFARCTGIHPETALSGSMKQFEKRFKRVEKQIADSGRKLEDVSQTEKDQIWAKTKA